MIHRHNAVLGPWCSGDNILLKRAAECARKRREKKARRRAVEWQGELPENFILLPRDGRKKMTRRRVTFCPLGFGIFKSSSGTLTIAPQRYLPDDKSHPLAHDFRHDKYLSRDWQWNRAHLRSELRGFRCSMFRFVLFYESKTRLIEIDGWEGEKSCVNVEHLIYSGFTLCFSFSS